LDWGLHKEKVLANGKAGFWGSWEFFNPQGFTLDKEEVGTFAVQRRNFSQRVLGGGTF